MRARRSLLLFAFLLLAISVALAATGGFAAPVLGMRISAHSPQPGAAAALILLLFWVLLAWRAGSMASDLAAVDGGLEREAPAIVLAVAGLAGAVAVRFNTFSASGADPSGYLSEAAMLARGALTRPEPLTAIADWPGAASVLAPLGWHAANAGTQVPTYAVGLPLLMALPHAAWGPIGASLVVAVTAALVVWFGGRVAMTLAGGVAGVLAAIWIATMPAVIFEAIQPMSDVPVTAVWLGCWWALAEIPQGRLAETEKGPVPFFVFAGIAAAAAVLIRPNLAPLAALPLLYLLLHGRDRTTVKTRAKQSALFALPVAAAGAIVAYLQWRWYGSPLRSGYGTASELYALSNVAPNARLYLRWLLETHGAWLLAAPIALLVVRRTILRFMLAFAALVCAAYFVYAVFETWSYLRFLLPALVVAAIAVSAAIATLSRRIPSYARATLVVTVVLALAGFQVVRARELGVFRLPVRQARAVLAGHYLASALGANAVLVTGEQSGAMRYYTGRSIVRWDLLDPGTLPLIQLRLTATGRDVWIVLDDWEVAGFREKFGTPEMTILDWPPAMDAGIEGRTQAWHLRDRERFVAGEHIITDRVR